MFIIASFIQQKIENSLTVGDVTYNAIAKWENTNFEKC